MLSSLESYLHFLYIYLTHSSRLLAYFPEDFGGKKRSERKKEKKKVILSKLVTFIIIIIIFQSHNPM